MGFRSLKPSLRPYHPLLSQAVGLLDIFKQNVAPLVHIFHMPTMIRSYWDAAASLDSLESNTEALLFAVYYSAVISMEPKQCESVLGFPLSTMVKHFQFAVQQALARGSTQHP